MKKVMVLILFALMLVISGCASENEGYYNKGLFDSAYSKSLDGSINPSTFQNFSGSQGDTSNQIIENPVVSVDEVSKSTFSIDVDTASYSIFRKYLTHNNLPYSDSIRTEEMVNYFDYNYASPETDVPFAVHTEFASCPWNSNNELVMIGIQGKEIELEEAKANNLVFLIDVSGSMTASSKLPMVKDSLALLVNNLREDDYVSIVTYAGTAETVLMPTSGSNKQAILDVIDGLEAGGGTHGSGGIELAYDLAYQTFIFEGNNRVILATDGDFNIGTTDTEDLVDIIQEKSEIGIYLTILGYGQSYNAINMMEVLSNKGQGTFHFIDTLKEADKVLNIEVTSSIVPIADDVKVQVDFNSDVIASYRLIGYENRVLDNDDFDDDDVDAGEIGAGHNVTAFYEVIFAEDRPNNNSDVVSVSVRYKEVGEDESKLVMGVIREDEYTTTPNSDFLFASAVIETSLLMRDSEFKGDANFDSVLTRIENNLGEDPYLLRTEFMTLVEALKELMK